MSEEDFRTLTNSIEKLIHIVRRMLRKSLKVNYDRVFELPRGEKITCCLVSVKIARRNNRTEIVKGFHRCKGS